MRQQKYLAHPVKVLVGDAWSGSEKSRMEESFRSVTDYFFWGGVVKKKGRKVGV